MPRIFYYSTTLILLIYSGLCLWLFSIQEKLLFLPKKLDIDYVFTFEKDFEEVFLATPDGERIHGLHFKAKDPKGIILYFHGNAGALDTIGFEAYGFINQGFDVLVPDYRTYGKSSGQLSEQVLYQDAELFYNHLSTTWPENNIVIYGRSIGTGIAAYLASRTENRSLILTTPYYNMQRLAQQKYPYVPVSQLLQYPLYTNKFILNVKKPIYIFHGTQDNVIPYQDSLDLKKLIGEKSKLITIEGADHNSLVDDPYFWQEMKNVLK